MPLNRYEIRNEYSLADPELYKSADRDDPEALLEGVAMAGLVGVLRQLGDLAEFAAEVFHNLHEEVMATAERGHSLKARVQQLELEFPLIEKAFLSQTNHSDFFYTPGVNWHPNMHIDQNYITRGDLPRFIMDSYEEARGPPQLFLLDKFDVGGAGACLKRFSDPSFFKVEASALGLTNADVQRDRVRKGKRRGSRWRNGETPEVLPTPHSKLHELLLEDRIENSASNPARLVKLKRRLNGFPFDLKTGKSYMEKILRTPPDYRELHQVRNSSPLKLEMDYFRSESPDVELTNRSPILSPDLKNGLRNGSMRGMEFETSNESNHFRPESEKDEMGLKSSDFPEGKNNLEVGNIKSNLYEDVVEKQIMVDKENKSESSVYQSDDVASEVENYMDALAAMESEMETDSELRPKSNLHVPSNTKLIPGLGAATSLRKAHLSDSQSMGSSTLSDDGNSASKKWSNSSYSGSPRILTRKACLEDELSDEIDSSNETGEAKRISRPLKWRGRTRSAGGNKVAAIPPYKTEDVEQPISITDVSSSKPITSDDTCFSGEFKDQHMEESVDKNMYLLPDVTAVSRSLDGGPLNFEEDLCSSDKYQTFSELANDDPRITEHPTKPSPLEQSENGLHEGLPNDESGRREVSKDDTGEEKMSFLSVGSMPQAGDGKRVFDANPADQIDSQITTMSSAEEHTKEPRLLSMPQAGDAEHEFEAYPVDKQIDSQTTTMSPAEQQTMEPRLPETETDNRAIDDESANESAIDDILQPLDPVNRPINNQTEEQFPDTLISETEYRSDGADHNVILPGGNTLALPGGEIAADMEDQALSGIPKGGNTKDIQAPVVSDSVPQPDVETSDNRDEILHELPSLALTNVASADDMLLLNAAKVETSSYQMENLHELSRLAEEELGEVSASTDLGERGTTHSEMIAGSVNLSDADVEGGRIESNLYGVDAEVPFSVTQGKLDAEEKPTIDDVGQHSLGSISPAFGLLPEMINTDLAEMPPLPPLPPVQWRMGKKQASLARESTVLPNNSILFPSMAPSLADPNAQIPKLIMPSRANAAENLLLSCESISDTSDLDHPSSLQVPLTVDNTNIMDQNLSISGSNSNLLPLGELQSLDTNLPLPETSSDLAPETQSTHQYLLLPAKLDEMARLDDRASTSSNASSSGNNGNEAAACDVELVVDSSTLSNYNKAQETDQNKILDQGSSSSESNESPHDASALPVEINREQPHNMILSLEGEVAWPDQEEGKPYGIRPVKPPRQRNPLIDAVMALDRSKFRKVTEQPKTNIEKADERDSVLENLQLRKVTEQPRIPIPKADERDPVLENLQLRKVTEQPNTQIQRTVERDSLLEQIRARTVNLKPTVVSRPSVQGPTNLKVAAILEKAKTIRQAFAGSDDDDDDDSWSDS